MSSLPRHLSPHLTLSTSMLLSLMQLSPTRPTRRDTSAHSRLSTPLSTSSSRRVLEIPVTLLLSSSTPRDSRISPSSTELEISLESTELPSDSTMDRDSSTLTCSTAAHGLFSLLTRSQSSRRSPDRMLPTSSLPSPSLASTPLLRRARPPLSRTLESGPTNTSPLTL